MPEPQDPDNDQDQEGSVGNSTIQKLRQQIKDLEAKAKIADAAEARAAAAEAENATFKKAAAFDRLNIPPNGPGKLFRDTYTGDLTDEAIIAKAAEYGVVQPEAQGAPPPTIEGIDQDAWRRQQLALQGTANPPSSTAHDQINAAQTTEELNEILAKLGLVDHSGTH